MAVLPMFFFALTGFLVMGTAFAAILSIADGGARQKARCGGSPWVRRRWKNQHSVKAIEERKQVEAVAEVAAGHQMMVDEDCVNLLRQPLR